MKACQSPAIAYGISHCAVHPALLTKVLFHETCFGKYHAIGSAKVHGWEKSELANIQCYYCWTKNNLKT